MIAGVEAERTAGLLLGAWALVDLLQIPLVAAVFGAWMLSRRLGRAWKGTAIAFAGYTAFAIATARWVPFAPTGFVIVVLGTLADPRRGTTPEHAWAVGSGIAVVLFWAIPTALAWAYGTRRPARARPRPRGGDDAATRSRPDAPPPSPPPAAGTSSSRSR